MGAMGAMGMMGVMGMMSKRTEGQQHCCCMGNCFFAMRAVAARWGYKTKKEVSFLDGC